MATLTETFQEKLPPQSIDAEKSLLGCLMLDKNAAVKVIDFVIDKDFYRASHQIIYRICQELFTKSEPIDVLSVSNRLSDQGKLDEIGGTSYLTELINSIPTASNVLSYAKIVHRKRILRDLIETGYEVSGLGYEENEDPEILLDRAEQKIFSIAQKGVSQNFQPIKASLGEAFERIDKLSKYQGGLRGIPSGFQALDNILAGFQKSDLIILAARPSMGKSAFAMNIAAHIACHEKIPVGIFSLEMSRDQLVDRLIADQANLDLWRLRTGKLSSEGEDNDFTRIQHALGVLSEAPIYIDDIHSSNILQMRAMCRRLQAEKDLGLIIIDYLQLMEPSNSSAGEVQQMTEISRSLKSLAKELNIPVLALSQLSRAVEQRSPQIPRLSDLRQSGSIEQDADVVLFIYREDRYRQDSGKQNIAEILVAKHRNGPVGKVDLFFDESRVSFRNLDKGHQGESF